MTELTEYVTTDSKSSLTMLCRSTSLTEEDTIQEDQEIIMNESSETTNEKKNEDAEKDIFNAITKNTSALSLEDTTDEADREIAVVEIHPPPLKEKSPTPSSILEHKGLSGNEKDSIQNISLPSSQNKIDLDQTKQEFIQESRENNKAEEDLLPNDSDKQTQESLNITDGKEQLIHSKEECHCTNRSNSTDNCSENGCSNPVNNNSGNDIILEENDMQRSNDFDIISEQYEDNSDEESAKETDQLLENLQLHDYVNVSGYPPPPVPPRSNFSHLTL